MSGAIFISDDLVLIVTDFFSEKILNFPNKFEIALGEEASLEKLKRQINKMLKNCKTVTVRHPSGRFSCGKRCIYSGIARIGGRGWGWL